MSFDLPRLLIEPLVRNALVEDLGRSGDITSDSIIPADDVSTMVLEARQPGVVAGLALAALAFELVDPRIRLTIERPDGSALAPGDIIARVHGPSRGILTAERVALNFMGHMSGIASATAAITALLVAAAAYLRTESRGAQSRSDFPGRSPQAERRVLTLADALDLARRCDHSTRLAAGDRP